MLDIKKHEICLQEKELGSMQSDIKMLKIYKDSTEKQLSQIRDCILEVKLKQDSKPSWGVAIAITVLTGMVIGLSVFLLTERGTDVELSRLCSIWGGIICSMWGGGIF